MDVVGWVWEAKEKRNPLQLQVLFSKIKLMLRHSTLIFKLHSIWTEINGSSFN